MDLPSETTGLLPKAGAPSHSYCVKDPKRATDPVEILPKTNYEILKCIFATAYPIAIALVLEVSCNFVSLFFASRVRNSLVPPGVIFAGVSLSTMFANVTCFSIHEGMTGAVETLASQANGAGDYRKVGIVMMRCIVILFVVTVPLLVTWEYVSEVLRYLGVADDICSVVSVFLRARMYGVPFDIVCISLDKYLVAMGVVDPAMYSALAFNILLVLFNYIGVIVLELDYVCIAWCSVLASACHVIIEITISTQFEEVKRTLTYPTYEIFEDWGHFFSLGIPGCIMICAEWWAYEVLTVFASILGAEAIDAQTIILQISVLVFMLPYGVGCASGSIVGNALGAGDVVLAKNSGTVALVLIFVVDILLAIFLVTIGPYCIAILTKNPDVIETTTDLLPFLALFMLMDGVQGVCSGILRGAGKQKFGSLLAFITYYGIGLPMAWLLTFTCKIGVAGLIMGIATGAFFQTLVLLSYVFLFSSRLYTVPDFSPESNTVVQYGDHHSTALSSV